MLLSNSPEYVALDPLAIEEEAVILRWTKLEHQSVPIGNEDAIRLLKDVRQRASEIERGVVSSAVRTMSEQRRTPRRKQLAALTVIVVGLLIMLALAIVSDTWSFLFD